jgi:hypothetical protein
MQIQLGESRFGGVVGRHGKGQRPIDLYLLDCARKRKKQAMKWVAC